MEIATRSYKTFSDGTKCKKFLVDANDGTIRAWDSVAGHYTTCHSLSDRQQKLICAEARKK